MLLTSLALAQDALPAATAPLLLPVRTTNLSRGEAVAIDNLFRAQLELSLGAPLYPADATAALVARTGAAADPLVQCHMVACPRLITVEVVRIDNTLYVNVADRGPDGVARLDLGATSPDLNGLAPLARDFGTALVSGVVGGGWKAAVAVAGPASPAKLAEPAPVAVSAPEPTRVAPAEPRRDPHNDSFTGVMLGLGAFGLDDPWWVATLGFDMRVEREALYFHGQSYFAMDDVPPLPFSTGSSISAGGFMSSFGVGYTGPGEIVAPFVGGGLGLGIYGDPSGAYLGFDGYAEGGVVMLRNKNTHLYLTGRLSAMYTQEEDFLSFATLDFTAGF